MEDSELMFLPTAQGMSTVLLGLLMSSPSSHGAVGTNLTVLILYPYVIPNWSELVPRSCIGVYPILVAQSGATGRL